MLQRFIELGNGYSDLYELLEIAKRNDDRILAIIQLNTVIESREKTSLAVVLKPAKEGKFLPIYICLEGIPNPEVTPNERFRLFQSLSEELAIPIQSLDVKPSETFNEKALYYQYLIGILRLSRILPPLG
ncbi:DUF7147 family protein [Alkalihalobacillus pseudalcaliphilus]|uniref:DUF7147 family protein n=1 Tax=Alkalihalobacillus pseudalcaliphilus TaxID=79884 RepID=UPI00064DA896|nr:hypothetical protein [Alkalihalobacillus pseudalcaliphilus]KMK77096.1 methylthioribose kinase [Alkalihalobacillus pseudalcaliphilus]